jgi:hypothetical protein
VDACRTAAISGHAPNGFSLVLSEAPQITSLAGFQGLKGELDGSLHVDAMHGLTSLHGLEGLSRVGADTSWNSILIANSVNLQSAVALNGTGHLGLYIHNMTCLSEVPAAWPVKDGAGNIIRAKGCVAPAPTPTNGPGDVDPKDSRALLFLCVSVGVALSFMLLLVTSRQYMNHHSSADEVTETEDSKATSLLSGYSPSPAMVASASIPEPFQLRCIVDQPSDNVDDASDEDEDDPPEAAEPKLLPMAQFELLEKLGEGSYAHVWKAKWVGSLVAVKLFKRRGPSSSSQFVDGSNEEKSESYAADLSTEMSHFSTFKHEVNILSKARHHHITQYIGATATTDISTGHGEWAPSAVISSDPYIH